MLTYLREVILENFMSYEYARIPFKNGLNLILGPNGAGKSSILLGISLALGQSHTERGRRLSDLIRFGKDIARVSIVFDNSEVDGKKPFPGIKGDSVVLTRILRRDGNYYFEVNYRSAPKSEVRYLLSKIGLNPENLLIIMHQNMIESFNYIDPREKLKLFEDALGLGGLRERIIEARERLKNIAKEESDVKKAFDDVKDALGKWEALYNKWLEKKSLLDELEQLNAKYAWARYEMIQKELNKLLDQVTYLNDRITFIETDLKRLDLETTSILRDIDHQISVLKDVFRDVEGGIYISEDTLEDVLGRLRNNILKYGDMRSKKAVEQYKLNELRIQVKNLESEIRDLEGALREAKVYASQFDKVDVDKSITEIQAEIKSLKKLLERFSDVDESVVDTYEFYMGQYRKLEEKLLEIASNRDRLLSDLNRRIDKWRSELYKYVSIVSEEFGRILSYFGGTGYSRLEDADDIDNAHLELYVSYGDSEPKLLDAYTQSGGERTIAAVSFLLAIQRFVKSPFRAIDEFDVHMDPRNRSRVLELMIRYISEVGGQYILITPGYIGEYIGDANVIVVQKVSGASGVAITG
ncbi:TPA: hypothetical protein EYP83_02350 [Candidatus Geothermarchaeota archaeon]|nr:hypothetical protein [Candidatus Geothermarchaeota archaeon]